jgi:uncharacterized protein YjcR
MHGAGGGAPRGNQNALQHGAHSAASLALMKEANFLASKALETLAKIK